MKNQTSENCREFIREASKIVHEWNVYLEIFSRLLRTDILQKTVIGCPWLNSVKFRKRRVLTFLRFCGNNVQIQIVFVTFFQIDVQSLHTGSHDCQRNYNVLLSLIDANTVTRTAMSRQWYHASSNKKVR